MPTTQSPTTTSGPLSPPRTRRRWRYRLMGLVIFALTIALFYAEENWRGRRAWENCKHELETKGAKLDWSYYVPPPVPDDQNFFGVPEMQKWFVGRGSNEFTQKLYYPGSHSTARTVVAQLMIGLPGATPPIGFAVVQWGAPKDRFELDRLIKEAIGPGANDPSGRFYPLKPPETIRPAQIFLECQKEPTQRDLNSFVPVFPDSPIGIASAEVLIEPAGKGVYNVTMRTPDTVAQFLDWNKQFEPVFAQISNALQRPYARMGGNYSFPPTIPVPNFVAMRSVSQRLGALANCYIALGQPGKALEELTLMHQLCRLLEARPTGQPMTLVAAMINVAFTGLYVDTIKEGMRTQSWQEPQLAALQEQLKEINLRPYLMDAFLLAQAWICDAVEMTPLTEMGKIFRPSDQPADQTKMFSFPYCAIPRGWYYQNMVVCARMHQILMEDFSSTGPLVAPHKLAPFNSMIESVVSGRSPFKYLAAIAIPNFARAAMTYAHNQTMANDAQIVCALERYRLAHGEYPATLEELMPQFIDKIPFDLIGGQPPHYHRTSDGKFLLYSIGWTAKDHGGQSASKMDEGDWVWGAD
jgi:hypothetical protein